MSQYYDVDTKTVWNPSNGISRLFMGQVVLQETEPGLPSGIGPMRSDESGSTPPNSKCSPTPGSRDTKGRVTL